MDRISRNAIRPGYSRTCQSAMSKLRRQLESGTVWSAKNDMSPLEGLRRAAETASHGQRRIWAKELLGLLSEADLVLRTRAIAALDILPADPEAVLDTLRSSPRLFDDVGEGYPLFPPRLDDAVWYWLADKPQVIKAVRERLPEQPDLVVFLAENDHEWVLENARKWVDRLVLGGVLLSFPADRRADLLHALGPWKDASQVLSESWWRRVPDADALREIVARG